MSKLKQDNSNGKLEALEFFKSNGNKIVAKKVAHFKSEVREIQETPEQKMENKKYRELLLSYKNELLKIGLQEIEGIWYFDECIAFAKWQKIGKIGNKYLNSFPSSGWNKKRNIGIKNVGSIQNKTELKKMFKTLGIKVATEQQELERYKNLLLDHKEKLKEIGLIEIDSVWYFFECIQWKNWPKIGEKHLSSFPNTTLNKKWGAGNKVGTVQDDKGLKKMFEGLGIKVATEQQELERYKNLLLANKEKLFKIGLQEIEGIWYFYKCRGNQDWQKIGKIGNKYIGSLIKAEFMKEKGIGRENKGDVTNKNHLKELFRLVGIPVATARQEIEQMQKDKNKQDGIIKKNKTKKITFELNKDIVVENFRDEFLGFVKRRINMTDESNKSLSMELKFLLRLPEVSRELLIEFVESLLEEDKNELKQFYPTNEDILYLIDCFVQDRIKFLNTKK